MCDTGPRTEDVADVVTGSGAELRPAEDRDVAAPPPHPAIPVISSATAGPRGLSSARNAAVARSRGEYIAFIDDDAVAHDEWLINLVSAFADRTVIGAGGHAHPLWAEPPPAWFPPEFLWVVGCSYTGL